MPSVAAGIASTRRSASATGRYGSSSPQRRKTGNVHAAIRPASGVRSERRRGIARRCVRLELCAGEVPDLDRAALHERPGVEVRRRCFVERHGVEQDQRVDTHAVQGDELRDRAAVAVADEGVPRDAELVEERCDRVRLRAEIGADELGHDDAEPRREQGREASPRVHAAGPAVEQDDDVGVRGTAVRVRDRHGSSLAIASATRSARTVASTSCTRTTSAPATAHQTAAASDASSRSAGSSAPVNVPEEPLAAGPDDHRRVEVAHDRQRPQQRQVVVEVLAEPDPRVDREPVRVDPREHRRLHALAEVAVDLLDDVVVAGVRPASSRGRPACA